VFRATLKSLFARKVRLALTALSVVLGVGFMAGTYVLTDTTTEAFDELIAKATSTVDAIVRSEVAFDPGQGQGPAGCNEREPVTADLLEVVLAVEGVGRAEGLVQGFAQLVDPATGEAIGSFGPPTCGISWNELGVFTVREASPPAASEDVVVDVETADRYGFDVGERIRILFEGPPGEFTLVGTAGYAEGDTSLFGATLAFFDLATAQRRMDRVGMFDEIDVVAADGADPAAMIEAIRGQLPDGVEAVSAQTVAEEAQEDVAEGLGFVRTGLLVFAFVALFVGAFIIANTFSIVVAQRTRELALLRTLGASRGQVTSSVLFEAVVVGLFAAVLGVILGILIAIGLRSVLGATLFEIPSTPLQVVPRTIAVSLVAGTLVTVLSAIVPARNAAAVAPLQALRDAHEQDTGRGLRRRLSIGFAVLGLGAAALLYGLFGASSQQATYVGVGAAVSLVGVAMLTPLIARPLAATLGGPFRSLTGRLGRENAMRNPRRTASTASALMIGVGLVGFVTIFASSIKASSTEALASTLRADFIVTSSTFAPFSTAVAERIRKVDGVAAVSEIRQAPFRVEGSDAFLSAVDPASIDTVTDVELEAGDIGSLARGEILVHRNVADARGWTVGDTVVVVFPAAGERTMTIGGIYGENRLVGDYVVPLEVYNESYPNQLDSFVLVKAAPGADLTTVHRGIAEAVRDFAGIDVQDQAAFREKQGRLIDSILQLVQVLLALALLIALFGIVNTLSLSIYERTREIGLLRAVGMGRRQVRAMIRKEAVIISVMGALFGLVIGVLFGWAMQQALASSGITELSVPFGQLLAYMVIAGLLGIVAAIWPARRAARLDVLQAISYE
jgi:putative ABC transport system permease protein